MIGKYCKMLFLRTFILSSLLLASCEKSDTDLTNYTNKILGKWNLVSQISWYKPSGSNITDKDTNYYTMGTAYIEFKANATIVAKDQYGIDSGKYSIVGIKLIVQSNNNSRDSIEIKELTDNLLTFYRKNIAGNEEVWTNYKK